MSGTELAALTWQQASSYADAVLAVPIGATEQHGPHLPLSTDTDIAVWLTARLCAARAGMLAAPPIAYGSSGEHQHFAGTLSIGAAALEHLLIELGRSAAESFARLLFVSCHGGNAEPVARACARLRYEGRDTLVFTPRLDGDAHAGRTETSIQLALNPAVVDVEHAAPGALAPLAELLPVLRAEGVRGVSTNGVLGDPTGASAAEGTELLRTALAQLCAAVDQWRSEASP